MGEGAKEAGYGALGAEKEKVGRIMKTWKLTGKTKDHDIALRRQKFGERTKGIYGKLPRFSANIETAPTPNAHQDGRRSKLEAPPDTGWGAKSDSQLRTARETGGRGGLYDLCTRVAKTTRIVSIAVMLTLRETELRGQPDPSQFLWGREWEEKKNEERGSGACFLGGNDSNGCNQP